MGLLKNYRLLKAQKQYSVNKFSKQDELKRAGTRKELDLYRSLSKVDTVYAVYHSTRLSKIEGGLSRREVDLIVVCSDKICLIEVKNYSGTISMNENGDLLQNDELRGWNFTTLDDSKKRLTNILRQIGVDLKDVEIHTNLALLGSGKIDDSVTAGKRYTTSSVFTKINDIKKFVSTKRTDVACLQPEKLDAICKALEMCGTWDKILLTNGGSVEGDIIYCDEIKEWRTKYSKLRFFNERGWFSTLIFGPKFFAESLDNEGGKSLIQVPNETMIQIQLPGTEKKKIEYQIYEIDSCIFGYQQIPDWKNISLYLDISEDESKFIQEDGDIVYEVGQIINNATVDFHHKDGIFFRLDSSNTGMCFSNKITKFEWNMRDMFFTVGKQFDVEITAVKEIRGQIKYQVKPLD